MRGDIKNYNKQAKTGYKTSRGKIKDKKEVELKLSPARYIN